MRGALVVLALAAAMGTPAVAGSAARSGPRSVVEKLVAAIRSYDSSAPRESKHNAEIARMAHAILDVDRLAQGSLDGQWSKLGKPERATFVALLKDLLEKIAYPKSAEFFKDLELSIDGEEVKGNEGTVKTHVNHAEEGEVEIEFRLARRAGAWVISDIYLDGVSLATNVKTQVQRVLAEESFEGLIRRMREKLADS